MQSKLLRQYRWLPPCAVFVFISLLCGCSKKEAVSDAGTSTPPAQLSDSLPIDGARSNQIALPSKTESVSESLQHVEQRQLSAELYNLSHQRTPNAVKGMIDFLKVEERSLPEVFPSLEVMKNLEKNPPAGEHWVHHIHGIRLTIRYLILSDTKDGADAGDAFLDRFTQKYGDSEVGQLFVASLSVEARQAKKDLQNGLAPWKLGLHTDEPEGRDEGRHEGTEK